MRIFFSVGEPSGDLHASNLIRQLKRRQQDFECVGFGGPKMRDAGCEVLYELTNLAIMFFWEAIRNILTFRRLAQQAEEYFQNHPVDAVVLIDYPGFNWWIAKRAKKYGIPVFFYGVPQMWAWAPWRIRKIQQRVDHVLCKLPFEADWFRQRDCEATYVGHPFFDQLAHQDYDEEFIRQRESPSQQHLLLLPGSRDKEVETHLPMLLSASQIVNRQCPNVRISVALYHPRQMAIAESIRGSSADDVEMFVGRTPELMKSADACIACSGSVSLELLHHRKPTVIVYKVGRLFMFLQRYGLNVKFITLVNLIGAKKIERESKELYDPDAADAIPAVMPEYLTTRDRSDAIAKHVIRWLNEPHLSRQKSLEMDRLAKQYAIPGATERAAAYILETLNSRLDYQRIDPPSVKIYEDELLDAAAEGGFDTLEVDGKAA